MKQAESQSAEESKASIQEVERLCKDFSNGFIILEMMKLPNEC